MNSYHNMFHRWIWTFIFCLILLTPTGCANKTVSNVAVGELIEGEEEDTLQKDYIIKDKVLAGKIEIQDVKARHNGDFLEGLAIIHNRENTTVPFEVKFEWFDEEGFPVESNISHWKPDLLYGKESKWIQSICPRPNAKGFKIMIRKPNPIEK